MRDRVSGLVASALSLVLFSCSGAFRAAEQAPAYVRTSDHYTHYDSADELAQQLRYGVIGGPLISAHRGGNDIGFPENALATFDRSLRYAPSIIECDIRMSADGVLVLMHDETLDRTSTGVGPVHDQVFADLRKLLLKDELGVITPFRIPTLTEALTWAEGRAVLALDVKPGVDPEPLLQVVRTLEAESRVIVIVYSLADLHTYLSLAPDLVYSVPAETTTDIDALLASGVDLSRLVGWVGVGQFSDDVVRRLHDLGIKAMVGTYGEIDDRASKAGTSVYTTLFGRGIDIIATDNARVAGNAAREYWSRQ